jgi:hypothetical protein
MSSNVRGMEGLMPRLPGAARLSRLQKTILRYLRDETADWERYFQVHGEHDGLVWLQHWGCPWSPRYIRYTTQGDTTTWTPTDRAVFSRALHRLEQRGLVERKNDRTGMSRRTTTVRLTKRGREIAKRLRKSGP